MLKVIIMRGLPGSGKSTWAKKLAKKYNAVICSADLYFTDKNGNYNWDVEKLHLAHHWCHRTAKEALESGHSVVIDNTNIQRKYYKKYLDLAKKYGASVTLAEKRVPVAVCFARGTHNVPLSTIQNMDSKWFEDNQYDKEPYEEGSV